MRINLNKAIWFTLLLCSPISLLADTLLHNVQGYQIANAELRPFTALSFNDNTITGVYRRTPKLSGFSKRIDGQGLFILPGLIDAHGHVLNYGNLLQQIDVSGLTSLTETLKAVEHYQKASSQSEHEKTGWLLGRGWNQTLWPENRYPTAKELDRVTDRPTMLTRVDGHAVWLNSQALKIANINAFTKSPAGGEIVKDAHGQPTGILIDNAMRLATRQIDKLTQHEIKIGLLAAMRKLASLGLTSVHDAGISAATLEAYYSLVKQHQMPIRVYAMLDATVANYEPLLKQGVFIDPQHMFSLRSVKISADGALGSRGAALHADYHDKAGHRGLLLHSPNKLSALMASAIQHGFQVNTHAIGDRANTLVLDTYQQNIADTAVGLRHRIEHAQVLRPAELKRLAELNLIASMQPIHATSDKDMAEQRLGANRLKGAYAWQSLLKLNTQFASGSDFPVEPANPFFGLHAAVTRQDQHNQPINGWLPTEKLSRIQALESFTRGAAYAAHQESVIGTLAPGYQADFILIDRDYFSVPEQAIWQIKVQQTWVAGKRIY